MKKIKNKIVDCLERISALGGIKRDIAFLIISGIALVLSLADLQPFDFDIAWVSIILCGIPIILEAVTGLLDSFDIRADVLVSLALIASVCIGEDFAAGEVAFIMQIGGLLEELTVAKAEAGIENLVKLTPQTARVITDGREKIIPAEQVAVGDILRVLPGETIAVDGVIISGQTSVNQSIMTGESLPVDKAQGDEVTSGTVNQFGAFEMRAARVGEDSSIQRMIRLVQSADAGKAKIVGLADRWATWIVVIALTAAAVTWAVTGEIIRAVTILVVFCPCSLVLATPTAIMAAIGNATKHGFLVRKGDALERLSKIDKITFDKTGTLTYGTPAVILVKSVDENISDDELYSLAAGAESMSEHPLGKAIVSSYKKNISPDVPQCSDFKMEAGKGVSATVKGAAIAAGNNKFVETDMDVSEYRDKGNTVIFVSVNDKFSGYIVLSDTIRAESAKTIAQISRLGIQPVLLTGDNEKSAQAVGKILGIQDIKAGCLPEDKLDAIENYQTDGAKICMIGDGVNDAPALKKADVGIAMGGIGSDIAIDAADIALVNDDIKELGHLLSLSRKMMKKIKFNLSFSMLLNFAAIILAVTGILNPVVGALVHNAGSVFVIINSAVLLGMNSKRSIKKEKENH